METEGILRRADNGSNDSEEAGSVGILTRKRKDVTIQTDEIWIIRRSVSHSEAWCPACREQTTMITPDEAALIAQMDTRTLYRQLESGLIHYTETPGGLLVCANSVTRLTNRPCDLQEDS